MDLDFVIGRLKAATSGFKAIGGAADMDAALAGAVTVPSAFVIPLADQSSEQAHTGTYDETDLNEFGVVLAVSNLRDTRGAAALATLAPTRAQVRGALAGWVPDEDTGEPVTKVRGQLLRFDGDGRLWWIDRFSWKSFYRSNP